MSERPPVSGRRARLRELVALGRTVAVPGATDALSARLIEARGFECVYIGSYATAASRFGLPDTGLLSLDELAAQAKSIADAVGVPVIADAEGGFHDAPNIWRTVRAFEQAGVAAIHIEDHAGTGKHTDLPQKLRPVAEAAARIRAAVDAREDPDFLVVARTDAFWLSRDLEEAIRRLQAYAEAGADMVFPTAVGRAELAAVRLRVGKPAMIVDMPGEPLSAHEGASLVLFYGLSAYVQFEALGVALERFKRTGAFTGRVREFEDFIGYEEFTRRAKKYE